MGKELFYTREELVHHFKKQRNSQEMLHDTAFQNDWDLITSVAENFKSDARLSLYSLVDHYTTRTFIS